MMKLSLLADAFRVWNIFLFCIHKQAAAGRHHIYQHIPSLPRLALHTGAGHSWSPSGLMFAEGCTVHTSKLQAAIVR